MKFTLITIAIFTLIVGVNASSYQNGFIAGMVVEKTLPTKKEFHKYNTVIIDTSLFKFPQQKTPMCRPIQVMEVKYIKIPFAVKLVGTIIMVIVFSIICNSCTNDPEFADFMLGYILGQMLERAFRNDD
jgi:hypothetical protein